MAILQEARSNCRKQSERLKMTPQATHVAVRDGRVLGSGVLPKLAAWGDDTLDVRLKNKVLMPAAGRS